MDLFTLYVGQGGLAAMRAGDEAVIVDAHMPNVEDHISQTQIEETLRTYVQRYRVRGLVLTGFDRDHAAPEGVDSILTEHKPDWIMYPKCYKDTDCTAQLFDIIERHEGRRRGTSRPLVRHSLRVDRLDSRRLEGLTKWFGFEIFSPHIEDMDSSNNSCIVLKVIGLDETGFSYLVTGDTETGRWDSINCFYGKYLQADAMAAPHHGSLNGVSAATLLNVRPNTVLISAGVENQYDHPHPNAVRAYQAVAQHVFATNATPDGSCLFTRRLGNDFDTQLVRHSPLPARAAGL